MRFILLCLHWRQFVVNNNNNNNISFNIVKTNRSTLQAYSIQHTTTVCHAEQQ